MHHLEEELASLAAQGLLRTPDDDRRARAQARARALDVPFVDASSNDYLGLAARAARVGGAPVGAGASRLVNGSHEAHTRLERELAAWVRLPAALMFSSGYAANVGTLAALVGPDDLVISDQLNHASLIDGGRMARARVTVVPHLDFPAIASALRAAVEGRKWVVVEACYSMDGDTPDLRALRSLCDEHRALLYVDEAHSLGVFGPNGAGLAAEAKVVPDVLVGTCGKALGGQGAFVAGSSTLRSYLWNRARSFIYSTAPSPWLAQSLSDALDAVQGASAERQRLAERAEVLEADLGRRGRPLPRRHRGPIIPLVVGPAAAAVYASDWLLERGILTQAIRPPTVPAGTSRLRITLSASHDEAQWSHLRESLSELCTTLDE